MIPLISSVQFSHTVVSDSLQPHELQHTRPPCPSPTPRVHSDSCPLSQWCRPTFLSTVVPFSSCLQSYSASGSFEIIQFLASGGQKFWSFSISPSTEYSGLMCFRIYWFDLPIRSDQISRSVVSDSLRPHESQHARPPCPSPTPRVHPNPCLSSQWCHPTILSSVIPFSSCPQSFPASGSFPMSQLFASGGQSIGISASISVLPMNTQDWSPLGYTGWISLQSKGLSRVFSNTMVQKHQFFSFLHSPTLTSIHDHWKNHSLD